MRSGFPCYLLAGLLLWLPVPQARGEEPNDKAARLLESLTKRPSSGVLFERFVNAWLDSQSLESLGRYLSGRVAADPVAANRLLLALFYSRQGEPVKALEQFRAALASDPGSAEIWYQKALLESRTLDFESATHSLEKCLSAKPAMELSVRATQMLGRMQARGGKTEEALKTWKALMETRPADEELREDILELQIAENLWPAALETAASLVEKTGDPYRRVLRRMRLGDVYDHAGQRDKALETFAACLEEAGDGSWLEKEILSQMERLFRREDDVAGLKDWYAKLLLKHSRRAGLQRAQARILMESGDASAAIETGRTLLALLPGDKTARDEFIALLTSAGRTEEAIPQVEQLLKQTPNDQELRLSLAELKHTVHDEPGALAELRACLQAAPGQEGLALRVAGLMDRYGFTEEAITNLRTALSRNTNQPETRQMLASLLHRAGKKEEALAEWRSLASGATLPVVQQTARTLQAHGESTEAWNLMQEAATGAANDSVFLTQLCATADTAERARIAEKSALRLVELAQSPADLNNALDAALRVVRAAGNTEAFAAELAASTRTAQGFCLLASLRDAAHDVSGADAAVEKARALAPVLALAESVRLSSARGDFAQAATATEHLFNSPGGRQAHIAEWLAGLHQREGDTEAALRWTAEWRKLLPGAAAPVLSEARLLQAAGRDAEALTVLRAAAGRFESNEEIRGRLAALSLRTGRLAEGLRLYGGLYDDAPNLAAKMRWVQQWGQAAQEAGRLEELIAQFEERRRENRESVAPLMALAELHRVAKDYDARRRALTEAVRLKPGDFEITLETARLESRGGDADAAMQTLRPLLSKDPSGRAAALMAELLLNAGKEAEGLKLINGATANTPASVEAAALSLARQGNEKAALAFLLPHLEKWPDDWRLAFLAGGMEMRTSHTEDAVARLKRLVTVTTPLARMANLTAPVSPPSYDDLLTQLMPPEAQRFFRLIQAWEAQTTNATTLTNLPEDPLELQDRAVALLLEISRSLPAKDAATLGDDLERLGFPLARIVPDLPPMRRMLLSDATDDFSAWLSRYPGSRPLLALAALNEAYRNWQQPADAKMAKKAWEVFHDSALPAALFLALPGAGQHEKTAPWEEEAATAAEHLPQAPLPLLLAAVRSTGLGTEEMYERRNSSVSANWRQRLTPVLERWQRARDREGGSAGFAESLRHMIFSGLAREYDRTKNAGALAALLDAEWRWHEAHPRMAQAMQPDDDLAEPLGFPPVFLPGLPPSLRTFIQRDLTTEVAAAAAPLVQQPEWRVILRAKTPGAPLEGALQECLQKLPGVSTPLALAAAWEERNGRFEQAAQMAVKTLYLPMTQEARRQIDQSLVYWAIHKGKPGDALFDAGREAVLRLRREALSSGRRADLAKLMDQLGLTEEADRLMRQGRAQEGKSAVTGMDRAERLLREGKRQEALPLLLTDLRTWTRQRISGGGLYSGEDLLRWRTMVQIHGMLDTVMQAMLPPHAGAQQTAAYAAACELTGDRKGARKFYEKALAAGLRKPVLPLLLPLVIQDDPARAIALMKEMPEVWTEHGAREWIRLFGISRDASEAVDGLQRQIDLAKFVEQMIESAPERVTAEFPVELLMGEISEETRAGAFYMVSEILEESALRPFWNNIPVPAQETERVQAAVRERAVIYGRLAHKLMAFPGNGVQAWQALQMLPAGQTGVTAESIREGMEVAARELRPDLSAKGRAARSAGTETAAMLEALMKDVTRAGLAAEFNAKVLPALRASRLGSVAESLLETWSLYGTPEDGFPQAARDLLKIRGAKAWGDVLDAAMLRKTGTELTPEFLAQCQSEPGAVLEKILWRIPGWASLIESKHGRAAAESFLRELMEVLLPVETPGTAAPAGDDREKQRQSLAGFLDVLGQDDPWTGFALRGYRDRVLPGMPPGKTAATLQVVDSLFPGNPPGPSRLPGAALFEAADLSEAKRFLDSLPVTGTLQEFYGDEFLLRGLSVRLRSLSGEKLAALGFGGERRKLSFGRQLLLVLRDQDPALPDFLAGWRDQIDAMTKKEQGRVLAGLRCIPSTQKPQTGEGRAFEAWLMKDDPANPRMEVDHLVSQFLADADAGVFADADQLIGRLRPVLRAMAATEDARGREILRRACGIASSFGVVEAKRGLVDAIGELSRDEPQPSKAAWMTGLLAEAMRQTGTGFYLQNYQEPLIHHMVENRDPVEGRMEQWLTLLGPRLQPGEARIVLPWLFQYAEDGAESIRWLETHGPASAWPEVARELEMALRLATRPFEMPARAAALSAGAAHFLETLRDASLPVELRFEMAAAYAGHAEPPLVMETARLLREVLSARLPVFPNQESSVFEALADVPAADADPALIRSLLALGTLAKSREDSEKPLPADGLDALVELALRTGDFATVDRVLEMENADFPDFPVIASLARHGEKQRLAAVLKRKPEAMDNHPDATCFAAHYDAILQSRLPVVVQEIEDPAQRFKTLALLTVMPDASHASGIRPLNERVEEMTRAFAAFPWSNPEVRDRVLAGLLKVTETDRLAPEVSQILTAALKETIDRVPLKTFPFLDDPACKQYAFYYGTMAKRALGKGQVDPLRAVLAEAPAVGRDERFQAYRYNFLRMALTGLLENWGQMSERERAATCEGWRRLMTDSALLEWRPQRTTELRLGLFLHGLAGRLPEFTAWHRTLPEFDRCLLAAGLDNSGERDVLPVGHGTLEGFPGTAEEKAVPRAAVFTALVANPAGGGPGLNLYESYLAEPGATPAEFLQLEAPLTRAHPEDGFLALAFAKARAANGDWAGLLEHTAVVFSKLTPSLENAWVPLLELRTQALEKTGHAGETLALIKKTRLLDSPETNSDASRMAAAAARRLLRRLNR